MALLGRLRSVLAFLLVLLWLLLGGIYQRLLVWPAARMRPRRRLDIVSPYMRGMSRGILWLLEIGGARLGRTGTIPTAGPVLILMNHQSLLDVPTAVLLSRPYAPAFVTRRRYARFVPVVSLCLRLIGCPVVDPGRDSQGALAAVERAALAEEHGLLIFPEGHRTKDGEIQPFRTAGAQAALRARRMPVCVVVTDGFWRCRRLVDFVFNIHRMEGETEVLGLFTPPGSPEEDEAFLERMGQAMVGHLGLMRERRRAGL